MRPATRPSRLGPIARDIREGLRSEPARAALAFGAIFVGMAALTALLAALGGLEQRSRALVRELGADVFAAVSRPEPSATAARLDRSHLDRLSAALEGCIVSGTRRVAAAPAADGAAPAVVATDEHLPAVRGWRLLAGRFLDARDVAGRERAAVITAELGQRPGWAPGGTVELLGQPFRIVGVVQAEEAGLDREPQAGRVTAGARAVYVPWTAMAAAGQPEDEGALDTIQVKVQRAEAIDGRLALARRMLVSPTGGEPDCAWITAETVRAGIRRLQASITWTAGSVVLLCLVLGGATLMSLMVANVRDRVTEIGLRRALGATRAGVAALFVGEGCAIAGSASAAAALLVRAGLGAWSASIPLPLRLDAALLALPVALSVALGALFSFWPARMAAGIAPAEALKAE